MSVEVRPFPEVVDADRAGPDPPYDHFDYVGTRLRAPKEPLVIIPTTLTELTGPAFGESTVEIASWERTSSSERFLATSLAGSI